MTSLVGRRIDRYEVVDEIGSGAVGRVYLAQDPLIGRLVAIKVFEPTNGSAARPLLTASPPALHEARAAGILSHPNIVTIHDVVDRREDSVPFIAMEYVRGTDLKEILEPGRPLPLDFTISVIGQIAAALDYAHANGVIHGDVKPANILITSDEKVKITDFGIARKADDQDDDHVQLVGTPSYVAPEQILTGNVDQRADLFGLGVILHQMLTGRLPYRGRTSEEILHEIAEEPVLSIRPNGAVLSPGVEHVLGKALKKDPDHRFQSAGELAEALQTEAALDATSVSADAVTSIIQLAPRPEPPKPRDLRVRLALYWQRTSRRAKEFSRLVEARLTREWQKTPKRRLAFVAAAALLVPAILGGAALLAVSSRASGGVPDENHQQRVRYVPLLKEGHRQLIAGNPRAAAQAYRRAEEAAPGVKSISRHRERAEMEAADIAIYSEIELRIQQLTEEGREALDRGQMSQARAIAAEILTLDPEREAARQLAASATSVPVRRVAPAVEIAEARPLEILSSDPGSRTRGAREPKTDSRTPSAHPTSARLRIDFFTHRPKGTLTLYSGTRQILLHPFRFVRKSGFFKRKGISGRYESTLELPPGDTDLNIYVSTGNKGAELVTVPLRMEAGRTRLLRIVVDDKGGVSAQLD